MIKSFLRIIFCGGCFFLLCPNIMGQLPVVSSFSPTTGGQFTQVTITGANFTGATNVSFGGTPAVYFSVNSPTDIFAVTGTCAAGAVAVTTPAGTGSLAGFTCSNPGISSFTPTSGVQGTVVQIKGVNFTGTSHVAFGGVPAASFTVTSDTTIAATVGEGTSGNVSVAGSLGSAQLSGFTYLGPVINSFTPEVSYPGTTVTISGSHFTGATAVDFNGLPATSFTVVNDATISAVVGIGYAGTVKITGPGGIGNRGGFIMPPVINSITPVSAAVNSSVVISGANFSIYPAQNKVSFGAVFGTITAVSPTSLTVTVPPGSSYAPVSVQSHHLYCYSGKAFTTSFPGGNGPFTSTSFATPVTVPAASLNNRPCIADFNNDGKPDIATLDSISKNIYFFKNNTTANNFSGTLADTVVNNYIPYKAASDDVNADGYKDVAVIYSNHNTVSLLVNYSSESPAIYFPFPHLNFSGVSSPRDITISDMDTDGRPDIIVVNNTGSFAVFRNVNPTGYVYPVSFTGNTNFVTGASPVSVCTNDFDGDGKIDVAVSNSGSNTISVFRNTGSPGVLSFAPRVDYATGTSPGTIACGDLDGDGKAEIAVVNNNSLAFSVFRNTSVSGTISFAPAVDVVTGINSGGLTLSDYNGDGKTDIAVPLQSPKGFSIFRNLSTPGSLAFTARHDYYKEPLSHEFATGDLNMDGKPDMIFGGPGSLTYFENKIGEQPVAQLCPSAGSTILNASLEGTVYQWQLSTGGGFVNVVNDANHSGAASPNLQLMSIPSSWTTHQYRCVVDGNYGDTIIIKFGNYWLGSVSTAWENPANWSCGVVPDINTDVIITAGTTVVVSSNPFIRSLTVRQGAGITISPGNILTITH